MDRSSGDGLLAAKRPRRCVQSKLSFGSRANGSACDSATPPAVATEDVGSDSEEGEKYCKRLRNKKIKPQGRDLEEFADNNKEAKESSGYRKKSTRGEKNKRSGDETPRKNTTPTKIDQHGVTSKRRTSNGKSENFIDCDFENEKIDQPFCDLWSEAKKAAEENLRLSAGKQTHPFFSICKASKVLAGAKHVEKSENRNWLALDGDYCISLPPVHVFETVKDDVAFLDWKNWKFLEIKPSKLDCHSSNEVSFVFEGSSIKPLKLEASCEKGRIFDHLLYNNEMNSAHGATISSNLSNGLASKEQPLSHFELVHVGCNFSQPSALDSNADAQNQDRLHKGRMASYGQRSIDYHDFSLWTDKYRPEISLEVCGNTESVALLCDWLKSWQAKDGQNSLKENSTNCCAMEDSEDSSYDIESDMDDLYCGETLKNVLLITGPVGSGKSAAIYACAREQGFKVIEVNASSLRNGAYMRQTFGEGVDSLGLTHWLAEDQMHQRSEHLLEMQLDIAIVAEHGLEAHSVEMNSKICDRENITEQSLHSQIANKTLFLFEEVDVVFDADHGFISTILKLAETTKRPIILTSNSKRPILPQLLDRLVLDFKAPSYPELLYHASMVCAFEKIHISYNLLEQIIVACLGDTRRVLMLLQFWCQRMGDITDKKIPCTKGAVPFDIGAVHLAIPKVIPWDFRCELSEKVEEEISKTVSAVEDDFFVKFMLQNEVNSREILDPSEKLDTHTVKSRRKGKLRKQSPTPTDFSDHMINLEDLLCDSDSPSMRVQRTAKPKRRVVLFSQSDDELSSNELKPEGMLSNKAGLFFDELKLEDTSPQTNGLDFLTIPISPTSQSQDIYGPLQIDHMDKSKTNFAVLNSLDISEITSTSHVCDTSRMQDESCMLESSLVTGFETNLKFTCVSKALPQSSESTSFDLNTSLYILPHADINSTDGSALESSKPLENHVGAADVHIELLHGNQDIGCFQNEPEEHRPSECQLMDDCSQAGFNAESVASDTNACPQEIVSVPETWRKLRSCENLKSLLSNSKNVALVASLTSGLADLISETDIMFRSCSPIVHDNLEPTSTPCIEPDSFSFHDELLEMGSTFAQHGLCYYTMKCAAAGSCLGWKSTSDLAKEMLTSSTNSTAIGKLLIQESITGQSTCFKDADAKAPKSFKSTGRESVDDLYNDILPIVPARLSMILRGVAFHEYLSFIAQMSRSECSRLAERMVEKQTRRPRTSRHYLSSSAHQLSSEQVEGLARRCCFTRAASRDAELL